MSIFTTSPERRCVIYVIIAAVFRHAVALASAHTGWDGLGDGGADAAAGVYSLRESGRTDEQRLGVPELIAALKA